jgi:hypothetical protein
MVSCEEFRSEYSDYRDGLMSLPRRVEADAHLERCEGCARYDRLIGAGIAELKTLPDLSPSYDFLDRLQHRIHHLQEERSFWSRSTLSGTSSGFVALLVVLIGGAAWLPVLRAKPALIELPAVTAHAPHRIDAVHSLFRSGPLLDSPSRHSPSRYSALPNSFPSTVFFRYTPLGLDVELDRPLHRQIDLRSR